MALRRKQQSAGKEALADDLRRGGDDHESVRVVRVDEAAECQRLRAGPQHSFTLATHLGLTEDRADALCQAAASIDLIERRAVVILWIVSPVSPTSRADYPRRHVPRVRLNHRLPSVKRARILP